MRQLVFVPQVVSSVEVLPIIYMIVNRRERAGGRRAEGRARGGGREEEREGACALEVAWGRVKREGGAREGCGEARREGAWGDARGTRGGGGGRKREARAGVPSSPTKSFLILVPEKENAYRREFDILPRPSRNGTVAV